MSSGKPRQYTVRGVPDEVDRALREQSRRAGCSLNEILLQALRRLAGIVSEPRVHRDLDALAGTWVEDPEVDDALAEQSRVDEDLWR